MEEERLRTEGEATAEAVTEEAEALEEAADGKRKKKKKKKEKKKKGKLGKLILLLFLLLIAAALWYLFKDETIVVNEKTIPILSPIDEEAAARIDAMEGYDPTDTWTFYLYWVGSDLESGEANALSAEVLEGIAAEVEAIDDGVGDRQHRQMQTFYDEIWDKGQDLPDLILNPETYVSKEPGVKSTLAVKDGAGEKADGDASRDLAEYIGVALPENVRFVIQTGGSPAWADERIDPNYIQRFLLDCEGFREIGKEPIANMGDPDTLADFLKFGTAEYPADHQVVILWNHGGGAGGYGVDHIFADDLLTLSELKEAFSAALPVNKEDPPLEMIYFSSCLMANAEAMDYLEGTARYLAAAEEVTITAAGACKGWLTDFLKDTGINGAQLGKLMVDHYIYGVLMNANHKTYLTPTSMGIIDLGRGAEVYDAYGDFAKAALQAQIQDPAMVGRLADAAAPAVFMGLGNYNYHNLVDLSTFMEQAAAYFPAEANAVIEAVDEAVLYSRATQHLRDAGGISVYYPYHLERKDAFYRCLDYLDRIGTNPDINALYYYKLGGCLNDAHQKHCRDMGYGTARMLDYGKLERLQGMAGELYENGDVTLTLTETEAMLLQDAVLELMKVDGEEILYLGEDRYVNFDGTTVESAFLGGWASIDGVPFALEIVNTDEESTQYRTLIKYRGQYWDLIFEYDFETEEMSVLGVRDADHRGSMPDRSVEALARGWSISPVYLSVDQDGGAYTYTEGESISYGENTVITDTLLSDGTYLCRIRLDDMRGDVYYSYPVRLTLENGRVQDADWETEYVLTNTR